MTPSPKRTVQVGGFKPLAWPAKYVPEVLDYAVDWSARLDDDDDIERVWIVPTPGVVVGAQAHGSRTVTLTLSGGLPGTGMITVGVVTAAGRTEVAQVQLTVFDAPGEPIAAPAMTTTAVTSLLPAGTVSGFLARANALAARLITFGA